MASQSSKRKREEGETLEAALPKAIKLFTYNDILMLSLNEHLSADTFPSTFLNFRDCKFPNLTEQSQRDRKLSSSSHIEDLITDHWQCGQ